MLALLAIAGLFSLALAQQYQGATITNSLPTATGARIAYFNIKAPNGGNTTLINYYSRPGGQAIDPVDVQRAIIVITGQLRDPWVYFASMYNGLDDAAALSGKDISEENVAILVPFWANEADAGTGYPATNGVSTTNVLVWEGTCTISLYMRMNTNFPPRKGMEQWRRQHLSHRQIYVLFRCSRPDHPVL